MKTILFIGRNTPEKNKLLKCIDVSFFNFDTSAYYDSNITRIGWIWENNYLIAPFGSTNPYTDISNNINLYYFSNQFVEYLSKISGPVIVDFITCNFGEELAQYDIQDLSNTIENILHLRGIETQKDSEV
jgi:hypothetical protein